MYQTVAATNTTDNATPVAIHPDDKIEEVVMIDGKEVDVKIANTEYRARRRPKVLFRIQESENFNHTKLGPTYYVKIYLPKTYKDAKATALSCFGGLNVMKHQFPPDKKGTSRDFSLKASIRRNNGEWVWAGIRSEEWWEMMNDLIEDNPDLELGVFPYKD